MFPTHGSQIVVSNVDEMNVYGLCEIILSVTCNSDITKRGRHILTTNLAAVVCVCVCAQKLTNFCPHAFISNPNVPKILFA